VGGETRTGLDPRIRREVGGGGEERDYAGMGVPGRSRRGVREKEGSGKLRGMRIGCFGIHHRLGGKKGGERKRKIQEGSKWTVEGSFWR
jgi:hypothetical protein